jgi:hypothetical protein
MTRLILALPFALALLLVSSQAEARRFMFPGNVCQPVTSSTGCVERSAYGVNNICQFPITVECPLPWSIPNSGIVVLTGGYFVAYDRNATQDISCTLYLSSLNGGSAVEQTHTTSFWSSGSMRKNFTAIGEPVDGWFNLRCTLPVITTNGISHLSTILLETSE